MRMISYPVCTTRYLFITAFTLPEHAGSGLNALNFANFLNKTGVHANILTFNRNLSFKKVEYINKTKIIRIPYINKNIFSKILSVPLILGFYCSNIFHSKIIFIYGSKIILYEVAIILAWLFHKKIIFQSLLPGVDDLKTICAEKKLFRQAYRFLFQHIDIYYSINPEFSKHFIEQIRRPRKILEMPQGTDINSFRPVTKAKKDALRVQLGVPPGLLFLSAGFLIRRKGYKRIFQAISELNMPFTYLILGDYYFSDSHFLRKSELEGTELYKFGKTLLGDKLQFKGHVSNVNEFLQCSDIFIHGSHQEGLPNVLLEAMATGLPVISYNISGLEGFFLRNGSNCLTYNTEKELVTLIKKVIEDEDLISKLGSNARQFIDNFCSFSKISSELHNKLNNLQQHGVEKL
jgi:glycosyltransferase involved in cell wall biosynthesis